MIQSRRRTKRQLYCKLHCRACAGGSSLFDRNCVTFARNIAQTEQREAKFLFLTSPRVDDEVGAGVDGEEEVAHVDEVVDEVIGGALVAVALEGGTQVAAHLRRGGRRKSV